MKHRTTLSVIYIMVCFIAGLNLLRDYIFMSGKMQLDVKNIYFVALTIQNIFYAAVTVPMVTLYQKFGDTWLSVKRSRLYLASQLGVSLIVAIFFINHSGAVLSRYNVAIIIISLLFTIYFFVARPVALQIKSGGMFLQIYSGLIMTVPLLFVGYVYPEELGVITVTIILSISGVFYFLMNSNGFKIGQTGENDLNYGVKGVSCSLFREYAAAVSVPFLVPAIQLIDTNFASHFFNAEISIIGFANKAFLFPFSVIFIYGMQYIVQMYENGNNVRLAAQLRRVENTALLVTIVSTASVFIFFAEGLDGCGFQNKINSSGELCKSIHGVALLLPALYSMVCFFCGFVMLFLLGYAERALYAVLVVVVLKIILNLAFVSFGGSNILHFSTICSVAVGAVYVTLIIMLEECRFKLSVAMPILANVVMIIFGLMLYVES